MTAPAPRQPKNAPTQLGLFPVKKRRHVRTVPAIGPGPGLVHLFHYLAAIPVYQAKRRCQNEKLMRLQLYSNVSTCLYRGSCLLLY